jgi:hypothetical protein
MGQEVHANSPLDLYCNESSVNNDASTWGIVPANIGQLLAPQPVQAHSNDYGVTLGIAGMAMLQGSWFGSCGEDWVWFMDAATKVVRRDNNDNKLLRALPNWDNLVGATRRSWKRPTVWNGPVYANSNSYADANVVYGRHAKSGKLFAVWRNRRATVTLRSGETVTGVQCADEYFIESGNCASHVKARGRAVTLTGSGQVGLGYILTTAVVASSRVGRLLAAGGEPGH